MELRNQSGAFPYNADDSISADYWRGGVLVFAPVMEFPFNGRPFNGNGRFTAVRR